MMISRVNPDEICLISRFITLQKHLGIKGTKWLPLHRIDLKQQYPGDIAIPFKHCSSA